MISWQQGVEYLLRALSYVKSIFMYYFIKRAVKTEISHDQLQIQNAIQQEQLEKAAAAPRSWAAILERMRAGKR